VTATATATATPTSTPCADAYESTSSDGTNATTNTLVFGTNNNQAHSISSATDVDWVRISLVNGHTYTITVSGVGASLNPILRLYQTNGTTLIQQVNAGGLGANETISYTPAATGTYFIQVLGSGAGGCAGYDYTLGVRGSATFTAAAATAADNTIWQGQPTTTWGAQNFIAVANQNASNYAPAKSLLTFDLTSIVSTATVGSASLTLRTCNTANVPGIGNVSCSAGAAVIPTALYPLLVAWSEANSSWNNRTTGTPWNTAGASGAGTDYTNTAMATLNVALGATSTSTWTFTDLVAVQGWVTTSATNLGMELAHTGAQANNVSYRLFESGEAAATPPSMTVTYS
jgi:hypothetical protein